MSGGGGETVMKGPIEPFAFDMKKMINNKDMNDIKFLIGPNRKAIYGHRILLSARCDVFRAMFLDQGSMQHADKEVPFVLSDITPDIFLAVLEFIYTNCVTLSSKNAIDVLGSSIEFGLEELRKLCNQYLIDNMSINNACDVMQAAVTFQQEDLKETAMRYIQENTAGIFKTKGFHEMTDEAMSVVLQSNHLNIDEIEIIEAVREWATVNSVVLGKPISEIAKRVVEHIRLPLLAPDELKEVDEECQRDRLIAVDHISYAWRCHALKKSSPDNSLTWPRKGTKPREHHKNFR
ncbi:BTB/POZ domain-containing protein 19-like isoform X2 [Watersipora subatra]|uniref:BTB/POZ domain-containing protein 19-like isoform X2 n=1 Tax=Watersipora subatra TaxID=2589382 RepID=UPI00355AD1DB